MYIFNYWIQRFNYIGIDVEEKHLFAAARGHNCRRLLVKMWSIWKINYKLHKKKRFLSNFAKQFFKEKKIKLFKKLFTIWLQKAQNNRLANNYNKYF